MKRVFLLTTCLFGASAAFAQNASMQSPAYAECTSLASSNPTQALEKADAWLKVDAGIAAQHCRAMALFGLHRYTEAGEALAAVHGMVTTDNLSLRSYVARQAARAYASASANDKALSILNSQIGEISGVRGDNASNATLTSDLLLERAKINAANNKLEEAAKDLDHAVSLTPTNEELLLARADMFEKLGDRGLATNDIQSVLKINKNNKEAKEALTRLNGAARPIDGDTAVSVPVTSSTNQQDAASATGDEAAAASEKSASSKKPKKQKTVKKATPPDEAP